MLLLVLRRLLVVALGVERVVVGRKRLVLGALGDGRSAHEELVLVGKGHLLG